MKVFRIVFERNPIDFEIVPLYDIHFGTIFHDKKLFNKVIDYIKNNDNTYCFLGGDIIEGINIGDKRFDYDSLDKEFKKNVNNIISFSIEYTIEKLSPIKDKILFAINGNHDRYMYGKFGVDIIGTICKELGIKNYTTDYECFAKLLFKHQKTYSLDIYAHHGHGSAPVRSGTLLNRLEDAMINFDANLYAMGHCLSEDTEILTKEGWKGIDEIKEDDEVLTLNTEKDILEYNKVIRKWVYNKKDYPELIHIKGKGIDILVTKDHRIIYKGKKGYLETTAGNPRAVMKIPQSGTFPTEGLNLSDDEIKLYAWLISEGTLYNMKNRKEATGINIYQNKNSKYVEEIKTLLNRLNIKYTIGERKFKGRKFTIRGKTYKTKDNCLRFYIWAEDARKIRKVLKEKRIPQDFKDKMNDRQWLIFLKELIKGDGYFCKEDKFPWFYYTKDKKLADDIQEMCIKHNLRCSLRKRRGQYELVITKHNTHTVLRQRMIKTVKNTGRVWCVSVANGTIVTRRNGKVAILGNTHQVVFTYKNHLKMNSTGTGIVKSKKWLIRVGGFRFSRSNKAMGYEEKFGLRPNATGTVIIRIEKINRDNSLELSIKTFC